MPLIKEIKKYYKENGRGHLPWRFKRSLPTGRQAYKILVSEVMLQQTQVDRVLPKYKDFIKSFPTVQALAKATFPQVLGRWSGLGYNRRAKFLHEAAKTVAKDFGGKLPRSVEELESLPGIGPYTARAIAAFAHNEPVVFVETNIRTVFFHSNILQNTRMKKRRKIADEEILPWVEKALGESKMQPRDFYAALMDYGSYLKKQGIKLNSQSKHYTKQSRFEGSARQLRGEILRQLLESPKTLADLKKKSARTSKEVERELSRLQKENLIVKKQQKFKITK